MTDIGKKIKELRIEKNLTQKQLSEKLKIAQSSISEWEKGKYEPTATAIKQISIFFNVTSDFLLGLEDEYGNRTNTYNNYGVHNGDVNF